MAQYKHDRFFKFYIKSLYDITKGTVPSVEPIVGTQDYFIDLLLKPDDRANGWQEQPLGLLDSILKSKPVEIVEHYSRYFEENDLDSCIFRGIGYKLQKKEKPFTWVLTAQLGDWIHESFNLEPDPSWRELFELDLVPPKQRIDPNNAKQREPFLFLPNLNMGIVAIERLPLTKDTAWLLLLGREKQCVPAYKMIKDLPDTPHKLATLAACERFNTYIRGLPVNQQSTEDALYADLTADAHIAFRETYERMMAQSRAEGKAQTIELLLNRKFPDEIAEATSDRIKGLEIRDLDRLTLDLLDFNKASDINDWLKRTDMQREFDRNTRQSSTAADSQSPSQRLEF